MSESTAMRANNPSIAARQSSISSMSRWLPWAGWAFSLGAVAILLMSARWKLTFDPWYVKEWSRLGWDPNLLPRIAMIQLTCAVLYLIPQTAVLGVVLMTGYLGGAISQYARMQEPYPILVPLTTCLVAWFGLYLREPRLRRLLPLRRNRRLTRDD